MYLKASCIRIPAGGGLRVSTATVSQGGGGEPCGEGTISHVVSYYGAIPGKGEGTAIGLDGNSVLYPKYEYAIIFNGEQIDIVGSNGGGGSVYMSLANPFAVSPSIGDTVCVIQLEVKPK